MNKIIEYLPFLIPLIVVELILLAMSLKHILTHKTYKHGNRIIWVIIVIVGIQIFGPVLYFLLGKEDA